MQEIQPYAGDGAKYRPGEGSIGEINKAVRETALDRSDGACSHESQGCPEEASMYGAVGWHQAVPSICISAGKEARSSRASNLGMRP
jgi:hypothetical protein